MRFPVHIDVPDFEVAVACHGNGFGLDASRRSGAHAAERSAGDQVVSLLRKHAGSAPCPGARAAGVRIEAPISMHARGRIADLCDRFGNDFCILHISATGRHANAD